MRRAIIGRPRNTIGGAGSSTPRSATSSRRRTPTIRVTGPDEDDESLSQQRSLADESSYNNTNDEDGSVFDRGAGAPLMEAATVCMTVVEDGPYIACACYNEERNEITMEQCHASGYETEGILERFVAATRPNLVLVGKKIVNNAPLLNIVTRPPPPLPLDYSSRDEQGNGHGNAAASTIQPGQAQAQHNPAGGSARNETNDMAPSNQSIPYRLLKSGAFESRACRALVLQKLRVLSLLRQRQPSSSVPRDVNASMRTFPPNPLLANVTYRRPSTYHALAAIVDFDSKVQVQALGSLLSFLQATLFRFEPDGTITVNTIRHAQSTKHLTLCPNTFAALHIFATEHHPLVGARGAGNSKEGFSLYSLLDRTVSKGGKKLLRDWMLKPLMDLTAITARQDAVEALMRSDLQVSVGIVTKLLSQIGPVDSIILRMQKCTTKPLDFLALTKTISAAVAIQSNLAYHVLPLLERLPLRRTDPLSSAANGGGEVNEEEEEETNDEDASVTNIRRRRLPVLLRSIHERCELDVLRDLEQRITDIVDAEATSAMKHSVVIRRGFHEALDAMKDKYELLEDTLAEVGRVIFKRHPDLLNVAVAFVPQIGFLVALPKNLVFNAENQVIIALPPDFSHIFNQDDESYFKNDDVDELDKNIGDPDGFIKDMEGMIVTELEEMILDTETELRETFNALSELDCILSFAGCASDLKFVRPQVIDNTEGARIYIKDGRHPLQEIVTKTAFIPNDTRIDDEDRVNVITGPNFSGKSCYARHVGVLVYMAHIGSFLPCTQAIISITDHIFARFDTVETCAVPQSSFQFNLTQMATILRRSTPHSLVLIDEFGKGTSPTSGISLLTAALKKLSSIRCKVVCTTHFLEIFSLNLLEDRKDGIKAKQMTVRLPDSDYDGAAPLFKLRDGVASSSAGLICARAAGMNSQILNRAQEINTALREGRKVKPLKEALPPAPVLGSAEKAMLRCFFAVEKWETASDEQLRSLLQAVARV